MISTIDVHVTFIACPNALKREDEAHANHAKKTEAMRNRAQTKVSKARV